MAASENIAVVAVHGAWADGSSWKDVVLGLEGEGLRVIAAPIPLTSLGDDTAALKRAIARTEGPVILAGHAYAGAVIATVDDDRVKALVYVAALAPDEGETVAQVFYRDEKTLSVASTRTGCGRFHLDAGGRLQKCFRTECDGVTVCIIGSCPEANLSEVHSSAGSKTGVEIEAFLVPDC